MPPSKVENFPFAIEALNLHSFWLTSFTIFSSSFFVAVPFLSILLNYILYELFLATLPPPFSLLGLLDRSTELPLIFCWSLRQVFKSYLQTPGSVLFSGTACSSDKHRWRLTYLLLILLTNLTHSLPLFFASFEQYVGDLLVAFSFLSLICNHQEPSESIKSFL